MIGAYGSPRQWRGRLAATTPATRLQHVGSGGVTVPSSGGCRIHECDERSDTPWWITSLTWSQAANRAAAGIAVRDVGAGPRFTRGADRTSRRIAACTSSPASFANHVDKDTNLELEYPKLRRIATKPFGDGESSNTGRAASCADLT